MPLTGLTPTDLRHSPAATVLIVDDEPANVMLMVRLMENLGYRTVTAVDGEAALVSVANEHPDLVLLDVNMPRLDGLEVCRRLKADPTTRLTPVVLLTGQGEMADRVRGLDAGADDFLSKPFVTAELTARARSLTRLKRYTDELDSAAAVILSLARTIEARDPYTNGHCERLSRYSVALGERLGFSADQQLALYRGGFLHDVGKVGVPDAILLKPGRLTPEEYVVMQRHAEVGESICRELRLLADVCPIVRHHHERLDGTGYPDRVRGSDFPLLAQVMSIVDAYDAMTTDRPYKRRMTPEQACSELVAEVERGWKDRRLVEAFVSIVPLLSPAPSP